MEQSYKITILDSEIIEPGEKKLIKLPVGYLPSGNKIYIHIFVNKSLLPGPTILLIGGIHGDEINGTEIVRRASEWVKSRNILKGTVITIPLLNVYGFIHFTREVAEGKDVNRSFPGSSRGSLASRIANILYKSILPGIDALIDFHTGGGQRYNYPQVRFTKNDKKSFALAKAFGAPFLIESNRMRTSVAIHSRTSSAAIPSCTVRQKAKPSSPVLAASASAFVTPVVRPWSRVLAIMVVNT